MPKETPKAPERRPKAPTNPTFTQSRRAVGFPRTPEVRPRTRKQSSPNTNTSESNSRQKKQRQIPEAGATTSVYSTSRIPMGTPAIPQQDPPKLLLELAEGCPFRTDGSANIRIVRLGIYGLCQGCCFAGGSGSLGLKLQ